MARYQLRRPLSVWVSVTRTKRQDAGLGAVGPGSDAEGPESPDSLTSSPSTTGTPSPSDSSDSDDDEPPSPKESSKSTTATQAASTLTTSTRPTPLSTTSSSRSTSTTSAQQSAASIETSLDTPKPASSLAFTQKPTTQGIGAVAPPQATATPSSIPTSTRSSSTSSPRATSSSISSQRSMTTSSGTMRISSVQPPQPTDPAATTISILPPAVTGSPAEDNSPPRRTRPEPTLMSKGAEAAAVTLSIIGAVALVVGILFYCKRRRRRRNEKLQAQIDSDAANYALLRAPETAHINHNSSRFVSTGPHMTQSSDRSNTLFGAGPYLRPETVSTNRDQSRIPLSQPTPNPFANPPLNKAYDVLAGRPRSTTLTDRGSWIKNPFQNPESERFDPFGELQAKARRERVKHVEIARREAEFKRQYEEKEKMGLAPPERAMDRQGSGVTFEGLGVLDRSSGGAYR